MKDIINSLTFLLCILFSLSHFHAFGQKNSYPMIGHAIPSFDVGTEKLISSNSLKGKYFILDFWNTGCASCVASFPKVDTLSKKFGDDLKIILIGMQEKQRDARKFFDVYKHKFNLAISSEFDSLLYKRFVPVSVPHLIWVNKNGTVEAITTSIDLTAENVTRFVNGEPFKFEDVSYLRYMESITSAKLGTTSIQSSKRDTASGMISQLSLWQPGMAPPNYPYPVPTKSGDVGYYGITAASYDVLFLTAFLGTVTVKRDLTKTYPYPIYDTKVLERLKSRFGNNQKFNYHVEMPWVIANTHSVMEAMQNCLSIFFQIKGTREVRQMPCYSLSISDSSKFRAINSKPAKRSSSWRAEDKLQRFINVPIGELIDVIPSKLISKDRILILNETGYSSNLTFELEAEIYDLQSIQRGLLKIGLSLNPVLRDMDVLHIKEGQL